MRATGADSVYPSPALASRHDPAIQLQQGYRSSAVLGLDDGHNRRIWGDGPRVDGPETGYRIRRKPCVGYGVETKQEVLPAGVRSISGPLQRRPDGRTTLHNLI